MSMVTGTTCTKAVRPSEGSRKERGCGTEEPGNFSSRLCEEKHLLDWQDLSTSYALV